MKNSIKVFSAILFFILVLNGFSQDRIGESKALLNKSSDRGDHHRAKRSTSSSGVEGGDNSFASLIAAGVIQGFIFVTYYTAIGDYELEDHLFIINACTCC